MEKKIAYLCEIAWTDEVGETNVMIYPKDHKELKKHSDCGIVEVELQLKRVVKKAKPYNQQKSLSAKSATKEQIKSVTKKIKEQQTFLKKLVLSLKKL